MYPKNQPAALSGLLVMLALLAACSQPATPAPAPSPAQAASVAQLADSTPAPGPGPGRGMMGRGMVSSGHAPGGLIAVSREGKALAVDANSELPENAAAQEVGDLNVMIALSPYPPVGFQKADFEVTLTDAKGQAITDASVLLDLTMPGMPMPPNKLQAQHSSDGRYQATGRFTMRDWWRIEVIIQRGSVKQSAFFDVWV